MLVLASVFWLAGAEARAHSIHLFAYYENGAVRGEVFARGGDPIVGATVTATDPDGETLGQTSTDDNGEFSLPATRRCDWRLLATLVDGHEAEYTVPADELPADLPVGEGTPDTDTEAAPAEQATAEPPASPELEPSNVVSTDGAAADLARQIRALRREVDQLRDELRWQDVIGGIGYILGLMGLSFYFLGVKRRDREPTTGEG